MWQQKYFSHTFVFLNLLAALFNLTCTSTQENYPATKAKLEIVEKPPIEKPNQGGRHLEVNSILSNNPTISAINSYLSQNILLVPDIKKAQELFEMQLAYFESSEFMQNNEGILSFQIQQDPSLAYDAFLFGSATLLEKLNAAVKEKETEELSDLATPIFQTLHFIATEIDRNQQSSLQTQFFKIIYKKTNQVYLNREFTN